MIVIPACGEGKRFRDAGYTEPKHLIPLGGRYMISWVVDNVERIGDGPVIAITQEKVGETKGAIDTLLKGHELFKFPLGKPFVVANCDQLLKFPEDWWRDDADGIIFTFRSANPAHSYVVTVDKNPEFSWDRSRDFITHIVEKPKTPPSDRAVSGVYWFREAGDFLDACREVSKKIDGEQYISAALSQMIDWGYDLYAVDAPTAILGTPEDFQRFETALEVARAA